MPTSKVAKFSRWARTGSNATCRPCPVSKKAALRSSAAMEAKVWFTSAKPVAGNLFPMWHLGRRDRSN